MKERSNKIIEKKCSKENYEKLTALKNDHLLDLIAEFVQVCNPDSIFVRTDALEDAEYIRKKAIELGEEKPLAMEGHTIHFDGYHDQARDKEKTKYLISSDMEFEKNLNSEERKEGLKEIHGLLENSMVEKEMFICFFCLGPINSKFSISCVQLTDSAYVAHSECILYRSGYEQFRKLEEGETFFRLVHSAGKLQNSISTEIDKRRIYIDLLENIVYSVNTQYAGNTVGLKKLSLRLAICKSSNEGWLAEHMFVMGVNGPEGRKTYFSGAYPSACGKTSTAMLKGETIIGDDIAYVKNIHNSVRAVNVEKGIFGIIRDVNPQDDPLIWEVLNSSGEVIFSNVLVTDEKKPFWLGDGREVPEKGVNYSGNWTREKTDSTNKKISHSHKNARYTIRLDNLKNLDPEIDNPEGVELGGIIYGGRDSDTSVPVTQAFSWIHGVLTIGATLESETTAATLGYEGVRLFNPMSNLDFLAIPITDYINNYLDFGKQFTSPPLIFGVNYFLKDEDGKYLTGMNDKHVWIKWMELRVHKNVKAISTPIGYIPLYENLKKLFKDVLKKNYSEDDYVKQFTLRIPELLAKTTRIIEIYKSKISNPPEVLFREMNAQKERLENAVLLFGDYAKPQSFKRDS